jgi:hypothetical protein
LNTPEGEYAVCAGQIRGIDNRIICTAIRLGWRAGDHRFYARNLATPTVMNALAVSGKRPAGR